MSGVARAIQFREEETTLKVGNSAEIKLDTKRNDMLGAHIF